MVLSFFGSGMRISSYLPSESSMIGMPQISIVSLPAFV